ncbi:alpha/beta-hydrolase [Massarina eburnea CBS 473.64]|uniref:Alpha/beta-hydrolase n=1 Tax=Massarina eburnea CBS 473.64 TaxID=1395130 RepID=A0A6A6RZR7_9PLEO|nr:alpha/beta-hydrolase [Massarina eburnea CBS 473.64]
MASAQPIQYFDLEEFTFLDGTRLTNVRLAYLDINPTASKVALVATCFSGRLHSTLAFDKGALGNHRVVVVALFGNGESASPSTRSDFPTSISYQDCVHAQYALLTKKLKLEELDVVLGFSMGGQTAYHWATMYPTFVKNAVIICSSSRTSRHNYQFLEGPSAALINAIDYPKPARSSIRSGEVLKCLQAFGKAYSAWLTSAEWFDDELYKELGFNSLEEWDRKEAVDDNVGWDPDDLLIMLRMWQQGDVSKVGEGAASLEDVLKGIAARVLLLPCQTDQYFRPGPNYKESEHLKRGVVKVIPSIWGHIAGGGANPKDTEFIDGQITNFLSQT